MRIQGRLRVCFITSVRGICQFSTIYGHPACGYSTKSQCGGRCHRHIQLLGIHANWPRKLEIWNQQSPPHRKRRSRCRCSVSGRGFATRHAPT